MTPFVLSAAQRPSAIPDGEMIRWSGAPATGIEFQSSDWFAIPLAILFTSLGIFWESAALRGDVFAQKVWGAVIIAIGLWGAAGRFVWDAYRRSRTRYFVTDRAAYIVTLGAAGGARRLSGQQLEHIGIDREDDGSGTIRFGVDPATPPWWSGLFDRRPQPPPPPPPPRYAFVAIGDVDGAHAALVAAQRADA